MTASKLRGIAILTVWGLVLAMGIGISLLQQNPQQLARRLSQEVAERLGVSCIVHEAHLDFWPSPGLRATEIIVRTPEGLILTVDTCTINIQWMSLLRGDFIPGNIELFRPLLILEATDTVTKQSTTTQTTDEENFAASTPQLAPQNPHPDVAYWQNLFDTFKGMTLLVQDGCARLERVAPNGGKESFSLTGFNGSVNLPGLLSGGAKLRFAGLDVRDAQDKLPLSLKDTTVKAQLSLEGASQNPALEGQLDVNSSLMLQKWPTPLKFNLPFKLTHSADKGFAIQIMDGRVQLDADSAVLNGLGALLPTPSWEGTVNVQRFSLPRWFGFARALPGGLQWALDDLSGVLETRLSCSGLDVPTARISLLGMPFTGTGGVPRFDAPVIRLDMQTIAADVNTVLPELIGKDMPEPIYAAPPALPRTPDDNTVKFDIRIGADKAQLWRVEGKDLTLQILPLPQGAQLLASLKDVYGGTVQAGVQMEKEVTINAQIDNINSESLTRQIKDAGKLGGKLSGKIDFKGPGDSVRSLFAGATGSFQAALVDGFFIQNDEQAQKIPFNRLTLNLNRGLKDLTKTQTNPETSSPKKNESKNLAVSGAWRASVKMPFQGKELTAELAMDGPLLFSTATGLPLAAEALPARLTAHTGGMDVLLEGLLGFDRPRACVELRSFKGNLNNGTAIGTVSGSDLTKSASWKGQLALDIPNLRQLLDKFGVSLSNFPADSLHLLRAEGSFTHSREESQVSNLKGKLDNTTFSGNLGRKQGTLPQWKGDLHLGHLNVQHYLPPSSKTANKKSALPWPVDRLRTFALNLRLQADNVVLSGIEHQNLTLPLQVSGGVLSAAPISANVYSGAMSGNLRAEATPQGLLFQLSYALKNADLLTLSQKRKQETIITGRGTLAVDMNGLLRSSDDIPSALNGDWSVVLRDGSAGSKNRKSKTRFSLFQASGKMIQGVLSSHNLFADGPGLKMRGQGDINLVKWTIYAKITASLPGVPDIPVTVEGSLDDPKLDVNTLRAIGGTLGNIGSGVFNLLGDVVSAPFRLLK